MSFLLKSCVILGYSKLHTGYKCFDIQSDKMIIVRHVIFNEIVFPFQKCSYTESLSPSFPSPINFPLLLSHAHSISPTPDSLPIHSRDPSSLFHALSHLLHILVSLLTPMSLLQVSPSPRLSNVSLSVLVTTLCPTQVSQILHHR
jgi:hypothetical protein